jgi:hypothetical protein
MYIHGDEHCTLTRIGCLHQGMLGVAHILGIDYKVKINLSDQGTSVKWDFKDFRVKKNVLGRH